MEAKNKHYPEEFKKQIVELYENGKSVIDLAREYGLVEQTIYKLIHRYEPFAKNEQGETVTQADVKAMQRRIAERDAMELQRFSRHCETKAKPQA